MKYATAKALVFKQKLKLRKFGRGCPTEKEATFKLRANAPFKQKKFQVVLMKCGEVKGCYDFQERLAQEQERTQGETS